MHLLTIVLYDQWLDEEDNTTKNEIVAVCHTVGALLTTIFYPSITKDNVVVRESEREVETNICWIHTEWLHNLRSLHNSKSVCFGGVWRERKHAKLWWKEIISQDRNWMDGAGKGYMIHPSYQYTEQDGYWDKKMSCNFNWNIEFSEFFFL